MVKNTENTNIKKFKKKKKNLHLISGYMKNNCYYNYCLKITINYFNTKFNETFIKKNIQIGPINDLNNNYLKKILIFNFPIITPKGKPTNIPPQKTNLPQKPTNIPPQNTSLPQDLYTKNYNEKTPIKNNLNNPAILNTYKKIKENITNTNVIQPFPSQSNILKFFQQTPFNIDHENQNVNNANCLQIIPYTFAKTNSAGYHDQLKHHMIGLESSSQLGLNVFKFLKERGIFDDKTRFYHQILVLAKTSSRWKNIPEKLIIDCEEKVACLIFTAEEMSENRIKPIFVINQELNEVFLCDRITKFIPLGYLSEKISSLVIKQLLKNILQIHAEINLNTQKHNYNTILLEEMKKLKTPEIIKLEQEVKTLSKTSVVYSEKQKLLTKEYAKLKEMARASLPKEIVSTHEEKIAFYENLSKQVKENAPEIEEAINKVMP